MTEWQPIETAPKDGTRVLLYDKFERQLDFATFVGAWDATHFHRWFTIPGAYGKRPTHWMPIPDRPTS